MAKECDDSSGHLHFYPDHQQQKNYGDKRTVDEKQHNKDHREAYCRDCVDRPVTTVAHIHVIGAGPVTYALTPWRRRCLRDDVLNGLDRFVPQGLALLTGEIQLNICGLTVGALRGAPGEFITPEILDVLHMLRIVLLN